jgi:hypothetical protein
MIPEITSTTFGSITIDGQDYNHDVMITLDREVHTRQKKLSKKVYGTSHTISLSEAEFVYEGQAEELVIGTGQYDQLRLSDEARKFLHDKGVRVSLAPTPQAIQRWNQASGRVIGLFHITC